MNRRTFILDWRPDGHADGWTGTRPTLVSEVLRFCRSLIMLGSRSSILACMEGWTRHEEPVTSQSWACANLQRACHKPVTSLSWACHEPATSLWWACHEPATSLPRACHEPSTSLPQTFRISTHDRRIDIHAYADWICSWLVVGYIYTLSILYYSIQFWIPANKIWPL